MPNIAEVLKAEISRLTRKEIRGELAALKKSTAQQRVHVAALRRKLDVLEKQLKRSARVGQRSADAGVQVDGTTGLRFRASGLASHRKRLGLSAADLGRLLGVSGQSIYKWETGEVRPRNAQLEAIAAVRKMGRREALARLAQAE
jgi:DNA-binding XRE family transcriptional regulator